MTALEPHHRKAVSELGFGWQQLWRAEQIHGAAVAKVSGQPGRVIPRVDGLVSHDAEALLGIYVADCGLIWLADRETGAVALLHSGRKGTEGGILPAAVAELSREFGTRPENLVGVLGPCIRPPHYEVDIASQIAKQAQAAGVGDFYDCGLCTGSDLEQFYSYRMEKGHTGRMIGLLAPRYPAEIGSSD